MSSPKQTKNLHPFRPAVLKVLKSRTVVEYHVMHPGTHRLVRKHIRLDNMPAQERRRYGKHLITEINKKLFAGWNPWLSEESPLGFRELVTCLMEYFSEREREELRFHSLRSMRSILQMLITWLQHTKNDEMLIQAFDQATAQEAMKWLWTSRMISSVTFNNYLAFYGQVWRWFIQNRYVTTNPFEAVSKKRVLKEKTRTIIPDEERLRIRAYWELQNPFYLVPCLLAYGCQIRRLEACKLKISDINFATSTILVRSESAKNGKSRVVTIPGYVIAYLDAMKVREYPEGYFLVSEGFRPGKAQLGEKKISDAWLKMRRDLSMPDAYQFYSLRDTGITQMLVDGIPAHQVRDQADHFSLAITDVYTRHGKNKANPLIMTGTTPF